MTLVAFDFDGTLSDSEMMVLLGERYGVAEEIGDITARAMRGELSYAESLYERAALLEGLPEDEAAAAFEQVALRQGAATVIERLNDAGHTTAILTGGFIPGVEAALERDGAAVDTVIANELPVADGVLTGDADGPLIEGTKDDALEALCHDEGITLDDAVAVGDGANDLPMLQVAGLAVGFEPKDAVAPHCDEIVTTMSELGALFEEEGLL
ncbi:phosphoserine phosphatase SerB [Halolamina sp.]|jgi:phosphoserine phosphatase|uniref:phosphoserine phosphatase SerB n=1 Tax=Halolamina sp. TaxID=1940283 RepID=UPI000223B650|nr:HAD-superfamily hydrolase, subfamily IB (PSPase-like) [halophilic archaeon DL31]